jgi:hypothetical protein
MNLRNQMNGNLRLIFLMHIKSFEECEVYMWNYICKVCGAYLDAGERCLCQDNLIEMRGGDNGKDCIDDSNKKVLIPGDQPNV